METKINKKLKQKTHEKQQQKKNTKILKTMETIKNK